MVFVKKGNSLSICKLPSFLLHRENKSHRLPATKYVNLLPICLKREKNVPSPYGTQILSPLDQYHPLLPFQGFGFFLVIPSLTSLAFPPLLTPFLSYLKIFFLNFMNNTHLFSCLFISFTTRVLECIICSPYLCFSHFLLLISHFSAHHSILGFQFSIKLSHKIINILSVLNYIFSVGTRKNHILFIKHR